MKKIASFTVNHNTLKPGIYISRTDGDCVTYDVRLKYPNRGDYLSTSEAHTIEHLFATFARNSALSDSVVYVGPMGCRTGFYLILRDSVSYEEAIKLIFDSFSFIKSFEGDIPGATEKECGNFKDHDLNGAKKTSAKFLDDISGWNADMLKYPE